MYRILLTAVTVLASLCLYAQNPTISIQGTLKDVNGGAVADGDQDITFKLYDAASAGTVIWQETAGVRVVGGIYSHQLGSVEPLNGGIFNAPRWLGVVVDGLELSPRSPLSYAPYAMNVASAQSISEGGCSGMVGDIKYSYLTPNQFTQVNGDCWVPMDGRSMVGSRLAGITGDNTLPGAGGMFLRAQATGARTDRGGDNDPRSRVGQYQENSIQEHKHNMQTAGSHNHSYGDSYFRRVELGDQDTRSTIDDAGGSFYLPRNGVMTWSNLARYMEYENDGGDRMRYHNEIFNGATGFNGGHTHNIDNAGSAETRPENLNFYLYIRIN